MPLSELTDPNAVLAAIHEFDELGRDRFLENHRFAPARGYLLSFKGRLYDSKAIAGVAYGYQFPDRGPLKADQFSGGEESVVPILKPLGFVFAPTKSLDAPLPLERPLISAEDIRHFRESRTRGKYAELSDEQRAAYGRIHEGLRKLGETVLRALPDGEFSLTLTSGYSPASGVRGYLPKDLWFAVTNKLNASAFVGMPQLYMIVSERGIEYGYAAAIHPSDFSDAGFRQRVRKAAPEIFSAIPSALSPVMQALRLRLNNYGPWVFRRKTRLDPGVSDFQSLDAWIEFLKSAAGGEWAAGAICQYLRETDLERDAKQLSAQMWELGTLFGPLMQTVTPNAREISSGEDTIRPALEEFLGRYLDVRAIRPFGQHDELKVLMARIRDGLESLPALKRNPHVKVSWSLGAGNWAKVPWIALMDDRETNSTQRGTYCVFLFPEDMSGVFLTLNQGVTETVNEHGRTDGRALLRDRADTIRGKVPELISAGYDIGGAIDLQTEGALGTDYEASTVAFKHYLKGQIPGDAVLNEDLNALLSAYEKVLTKDVNAETGSTGSWIFQGNPKRFDIDGAVAQLPELTWTVRDQAQKAAAVGDRVFLWRSGSQAGIVAIATITQAASEIEMPAEEDTFVRDKDLLGGIKWRVRIRIDRHIEPTLLKTTIAAEPQLRDLMILRFANYGTFPITRNEADALMELLDEGETVEPERTQRIWLYSPGRNAEHWDELYEKGLIAIGWDKLGDLSQFGSIDDVLGALATNYEAEGQTNNARTCYDFVRTVDIGDLVFVKRGRSTIIGYGIITGAYRHQPERAELKNVRSVRWEGRGEWAAPSALPIKTLTNITSAADLVQSLKRLVTILPAEPSQPLPIAAREPFSVDQAIDGLFMPREEFERALKVWEVKKNLILQGAPGVGKSFVAKRLAYALMKYRDPSRVRTVQFHQSYSYEDFIQGYRPEKGGGFELKAGVFLEFCERALADSKETYVFIIDEINRGNLSKIFGELMLLIEPDKRSAEWATKLTYARSAEERFYVPENVFVLGMMNTADRSISLVDYALRRRFAFFTLKPQYNSQQFRSSLLACGVSSTLVDRIVERMSAMNVEIAKDTSNLGPGFCIGHSFFSSISDGTVADDAWYRQVIETEIAPLLREYWFDRDDRATDWCTRLLAE